ncbi:hypothetical protein CC79DRAFT_1358713 [Sarocladium strictum]
MIVTAATLPGSQPFEANNATTSSYFPVNPFNNFRDKPNHHPHRRQKENSRQNAARQARENALLDQANREAAMQHTAQSQAAQASRDVAHSYLERFLETSEWKDHVGQVGIIEEAVPTMEELEEYGTLDEADGTRACRKMFKAVVVWEQVGHSLWERLRDEVRDNQGVEEARVAETPTAPTQPEDAPRRQSHHRHASRDVNALSIIMEQPLEPQQTRRSSLTSSTSSLFRSRKASLTSLISDRRPNHATSARPSQRPQPITRRSSSVPVSPKSRRKLYCDRDNEAEPEQDCLRRSTDPGPRLQKEWDSDRSRDDAPAEGVVKAAATFPRKLSKNCANARLVSCVDFATLFVPACQTATAKGSTKYTA